MSTLLSRSTDAIRVWLGLNDPAENRLHASHGWLLPSVAEARAGVDRGTRAGSSTAHPRRGPLSASPTATRPPVDK